MSNLDLNDPSVIESFLANCIQQRFGAGETIVKQGAISNTIYYILSGQVSVVYHSGDHESYIAELTKGDFFGEMALMDPANKRTAEIRTKSVCDLACLTYEDFEMLAMKQPKLLIVLVGQLIHRLRQSNRKYMDLNFLMSCGATAKALIDLTKLPDATQRDQGYEIQVSPQELSKLTGLSLEVTVQVLDYLASQNLVAHSPMTLLIKT